VSGSGVSGGVKACKAPRDVPDCAAKTAAGHLSCRRRMDNYDNPYRDDPESVPQTRAGRLVECGIALLLAVLAVYLSR
jgi:hypothetical protein